MRLSFLTSILTLGLACTSLAATPDSPGTKPTPAAPGKSASMSNSTPLDLASYRGKVVYLDFWASWCGPCRESFPWMDSLQDIYAKKGLAVVALNVDRKRNDADQFLAKHPPHFAVFFDPDGTIADQFKVNGMPETVLIDRSGKVRYEHIGFRPADRAELDSKIRELLAQP